MTGSATCQRAERCAPMVQRMDDPGEERLSRHRLRMSKGGLMLENRPGGSGSAATEPFSSHRRCRPLPPGGRIRLERAEIALSSPLRGKRLLHLAQIHFVSGNVDEAF